MRRGLSWEETLYDYYNTYTFAIYFAGHGFYFFFGSLEEASGRS